MENKQFGHQVIMDFTFFINSDFFSAYFGLLDIFDFQLNPWLNQSLCHPRQFISLRSTNRTKIEILLPNYSFLVSKIKEGACKRGIYQINRYSTGILWFHCLPPPNNTHTDTQIHTENSPISMTITRIIISCTYQKSVFYVFVQDGGYTVPLKKT